MPVPGLRRHAQARRECAPPGSSLQADRLRGRSWYKLCIKAALAQESAPEPLAQQEIKFYPQFGLFSTNPARAGT